MIKLEMQGNLEGEIAGKLALMRQAVSQGLIEGGNQFVEYLRKTQFSGRPGLKQQSGKAYRSFRVKMQGPLKIEISNYQDYVIYHQTGTRNLPKRLHMYEAWITPGQEMMQKAIQTKIDQMVK
jgi:hypothetical protein